MSVYGDSNFIKKINLYEEEYLIPSSDKYHQYSGRYYIDGVNGDDSNDGLTSATPFKTIERLLELFNKGMCDVRCYIISAGTYTISKTTCEECTLHIQANVDGVELKYVAGGVFYNSHINLKGLDSTHPLVISTEETDTELIYFENCAVALNSVKFKDFSKVSFIGGFVNSNNSIFPILWCDGVNGEFIDTEISRPDLDVGIMARRGCNLIVRSNLKFGEVSSTYNLINVERSRFVFYPLTLGNNSQITTGTSIQSRTSIIQSTTNVINSLDALASTNHDFGAATLWVTTNATIPV